ncbi:MAG: hypothetical protein EPO68_09210 [Planctomycetota bacterium]|nr:MAG: hypothetical protein EPO68_09210 [Planctomycetota bacterium]
MESSIARIASPAPLPAIRERRESRGGRDPRSSTFQRALGGEPDAAPADADVRAESADAGAPLDEEPGRIVDFAA